MFTLDTERLLIRPWSEADRPVFKSMMAHPDVTQYVHRAQPYTDQEVDDFFARQTRQLAEHDLCMGALVEKSTGTVIGIAGVQPLGEDLEIGWILGRESWGRGYATEAGAAAMRHVLHTVGRSRVVAIIDPENEPSKRVAARLGMVWDGRYTGAQLGHRTPEIVVDRFIRAKEVESGR